MQEKWHSLAEHPIVGETRMVGLMGAMELVANKSSSVRYDNKSTAGTVYRDFAVNNGLVMRAVGDTIVTSPPLIISNSEVDELIDKAWKCLDHTYKTMTS
jgi:putrescine aminotransferase